MWSAGNCCGHLDDDIQYLIVIICDLTLDCCARIRGDCPVSFVFSLFEFHFASYLMLSFASWYTDIRYKFVLFFEFCP